MTREIIYAAANAGGVAVSGLEMSQIRTPGWNREKLDQRPS